MPPSLGAMGIFIKFHKLQKIKLEALEIHLGDKAWPTVLVQIKLYKLNYDKKLFNLPLTQFVC